jgi:hypothetical protein
MALNEGKHVFISYVKEDSEQVGKLCSLLDAAQIPYWRDRKSLAPGDQWKEKIREAIRTDSLVFITCFSNNSRSRAKSFMNEELTIAVEEFRLRPPGATWLIPVRFDDGSIPYWDLGAGRSLEDLNYADLFGDNYTQESVALITTIGRVMGTLGPDAATARAAVDEASASDRPAMLRRITKEFLPNPAKRIELDSLVSQEITHILAVMRDEERFPLQGLTGDYDAQVIELARLADTFWHLVEPFCFSLQVAARWGEPATLAPWISGIRTLTGEAAKTRAGLSVLVDLHHIPALYSIFTATLASVGQQNWSSLKALISEGSVVSSIHNGRVPLLDAVTPYSPFSHTQNHVADVVARVATTDDDATAAFEAFTRRQNRIGGYYTPVADWLHAALRPVFADQFHDESIYSDEFDRAEVVLGLLSQDSANVRARAASDRAWTRRVKWFGRSTWRAANGHSDALGDISAELEAQGESWGPLAAGLFGHDVGRAVTAVADYSEQFNRLRDSRL